MKTIFKGLAYLYVAVALAPLVLLAVGLGVSLAVGKSFWPFLPYGPPQIEDESQPLKEEITFRAGPMLVAGEQGGATAQYAMGVGQVSARPAAVLASGPAVDTFYVVGMDVEYAGITASQAGDLNNVLMLQKTDAAPRKLFDRPVSVKFFAAVDTPNGRALVILATDKDTNKDGKLNSKDMHTVYMHLLDGVAPREIAGIPGSVVAVDMMSQPGALLVRTVLDSNGDGSAARGIMLPYGQFTEEPQRMYRIDLKTLEASPVVPPSTIDELQKALDARAAPPAPPAAPK